MAREHNMIGAHCREKSIISWPVSEKMEEEKMGFYYPFQSHTPNDQET
jgi:hypothetical protein